MTSEKHSISVREITLYALLGTVMFALKMALSGLPNIEPVSLLVILYTLAFGRRAAWSIALYEVLELSVWGVHLWTLNYLYVWAVLALLAHLFRAMTSPLGWAVLAGAFGLCFGLLCAPVYWITGGWAFALSWWISGIPFDLIHGIGNFFITLVLFKPCRRILLPLTAAYLKK